MGTQRQRSLTACSSLSCFIALANTYSTIRLTPPKGETAGTCTGWLENRSMSFAINALPNLFNHRDSLWTREYTILFNRLTCLLDVRYPFESSMKIFHIRGTPSRGRSVAPFSWNPNQSRESSWSPPGPMS